MIAFLLFILVFLFQTSLAKVEYGGIFVLPKSGTIYLKSFFGLYVQGIKNPALDYKSALITNNFSGREIEKLGFKKGLVAHEPCPGFSAFFKQDSLYGKWHQLKYFTHGWECSGSDEEIREKIERSMINQSLNFKIVFVYRNPLDHLVSYHRYNMFSKGNTHRYADSKTPQEISLYDHSFREGGLESYIKFYYTFFQMAKNFPHNIKFVTYEELSRNPQKTILSIMKFLECSPKTFKERRAFTKAFQFTRFETFKKIEHHTQESLGRDLPKGMGHIQSGKVGRWKGKFTQKHLEQIEKKLNEFNLSLKYFTLK